MTGGRIRHMDYCKGIAIILVVAGHYFPAESPEAWKTIRAIIYTFHMPLFFFASGFFFAGEPERGIAELLAKKAARLLIPFATIALVFLLMKLPASLFFDLEHGLNARAVLNAVLDPVRSHVPLLWFMQALFIMFALFAVLRGVCGIPPPIMFALFAVLSFLKPPAYFSLDSVFRHMQFFCFGYLARRYAAPSALKTACLAAAPPLFAVNAVFLANHPGNVYAELLSGYLGIASALALSLLMDKADSRVFAWIEKAGLFSMGIYLLHPFFESAIRILYYQILRLSPAYFWIGLGAGVLAGLVPSALAEKYVLRRYGISRKFLLGLNRTEPGARA